MSKQFHSRGYPKHVVKLEYNKAIKYRRESLLSEETSVSPNKFACSFQYTHLAQDIKKSFFKYCNLVQHIPGCGSLSFIGLRKTNSLKNALVSSDMNIQLLMTSRHNGHFKYHKCGECDLALEIDTFTHPSGSPTINFRRRASSLSQNTIYIILCPCPKVYLGMSNHGAQITYKK